MQPLLIATALAGIAATALAILALAGFTAAGPALLGLLAGLLIAVALLLLGLRDAGRLTEAVRRIGQQATAAEIPGTALLEGLAREIARLSRRLASRAAELEQHRRADTLILERLPDPVIVLARDRAARRSNAAARAAFGEDMPAVLRHPGIRAAVDRALATSQAQTAEVALSAPFSRDLYATVVPMDPPLADGGELLIVLSDRTRERLVERMRADFVANVSHELRTPLASLIGFTETLRGAAADDRPAQQRFLGIMAEQGARMNRLIDDLLSLSRIELTEHQPPSDVLDLRALLPRLAAGFEPRLAERDIRLAMQIADDLPAVSGDADQLAQVLQNLLDNAVKYGREGGTVRLCAAPPDRRAPPGAASAEPPRRMPPWPAAPLPASPWPARPGIVISVADEGSGIPRQHLPRLTERFYRVDKGRSRAVGGTGLGLAIVKHIVNRHRGQLLIESEEGKGTTVSVWLPTAPATSRGTDLAPADRTRAAEA